MQRSDPKQWRLLLPVLMLLPAVAAAPALALQVSVQDHAGNPVSGFKWLVEEDTTHVVAPGVPTASSIGLSIHNSYAPVVAGGRSDADTADIGIPTGKRYIVSVLPYAGYSMGGGVADVDDTEITVTVSAHPMPTAQISVYAFTDWNPINNVHDEHEQGIGGATVVISDPAGQVMMDAFGNMLGTRYEQNPDGSFVYEDGAPKVLQPGTGVITTLTQEDFDANNNPYNLKVGEALVKYIPPGKYGVVVVPPGADDNGVAMEWTQTSTIEGTPTIDAWVKANEPKLFVEGFGTGFNHVFVGFIKVAPTVESPFKGQTFAAPAWLLSPPNGTGSISGRLRLNHFSRPPTTQGFWPGAIIEEGWVGLNDPLVRPGAAVEAGGALQFAGLYTAPCNPDGTFLIENVPPGTYELLTWDTPLDNLFGFHTVTVGPGENVNLGDVLEYRWFGTLEGRVFLDADEDGFPDPGEGGIRNQAVNLRFRDGTIYQATQTDPMGDYSFAEVFPFFKWLVVEVDFARFKATGLTAVVDNGGEVLPDDGWVMPSRDKLNPQPQVDENGNPIINPNTITAAQPLGNNLSRTVVGEVLTQAMHLFLNQTNIIEWGKTAYGPGENGGISGIAFYTITRAEDDPRYAAAEEWEPGIPNVQVNLYRDLNRDGVIDDLNGDGWTLADVDNWPFGWRDDPAAKGPEDVDRNNNGDFDAGDALQIVTTDSWDDSKPEGSIGPDLTIHGQTVPVGFDAFGTWNQVRDGIFDGGYAFTSYYPAGMASPGAQEVEGLANQTYIVEAATPYGYELVKEEDKNVDFGDEWTPSPLLLPPICVGDPHEVPQYLSFQTDDSGVPLPGIDPADLIEAPYAGQIRPKADRKQIHVSAGKNAAADFFFMTDTPKAARGVGFVNNDLTAEFNQDSPNFGEKLAPSWIPIALQDWTGHEIGRVYCDEFGCYNFLIPSTYTVNLPTPTGVSPNMMTLVLNAPILPDGTIDPFYNPIYSITPWTFNYSSGTTTYLDTPLVPLAAFSAAEIKLDTEPQTLTPVIESVDGPEPGFGPVLNSTRTTGRVITIRSVGTQSILNPAYNPAVPGTPYRIDRNYGFGTTSGTVRLDGQTLPIQSWSDLEIQASVPAGAQTGRITVTRGDNGTMTELGVTLHIVNTATTPVHHVPAEFDTIQAAIDAAAAGDLILVAPGLYNEMVVMNKPVRLQGAAAGGTTIFGYPNPRDELQLWHDRVDALGARDFAAFLLKDPFGESEAPCIIVIGETVYPNGNLQNELPGTKTLNPGNPFNQPGKTLIDGFTLTGSKAGGAVFAISGVADLVVSNNNATGNQGSYGGGIIFGTQDSGFDCMNYNPIVRWNKVHKNGGIQGPGGINMNEHAHNYLIEDNIVWGNFSRFNGGGIGHRGYCPGVNVIRRNKVLFNEDHFTALLAKAGDGGGIYIGGDVTGGTGAGNVDVIGNLIQGNMTGSGYGGGIRAFAINAQDVLESPDDSSNWYTLNIYNNMIVNNVAGLGGAGISLQDAAQANIIHNTIVNNDCTATAKLAFAAGSVISTPQPSGVQSAPHSDLLMAMFGAGLEQEFSNPVLRDNIIHTNRSWYYDPALNGGQGGLLANPDDPIWDLGVIGLPASHYLEPTNSVLTSFTDSSGADYNEGTNVAADPSFADPYLNDLATAAVLDEGGNFLNVQITPLTVEGDYHITCGSPAINIGDFSITTRPPLNYDFDLQRRPGGMFVDAGADELIPGCSADFDVDGDVDFTDYGLLVANWLNVCQNYEFSPCDLNQDGIVNATDLALFGQQYGRNDCCTVAP